jgi:hypothetical protein
MQKKVLHNEVKIQYIEKTLTRISNSSLGKITKNGENKERAPEKCPQPTVKLLDNSKLP